MEHDSGEDGVIGGGPVPNVILQMHATSLLEVLVIADIAKELADLGHPSYTDRLLLGRNRLLAAGQVYESQLIGLSEVQQIWRKFKTGWTTFYRRLH